MAERRQYRDRDHSSERSAGTIAARGGRANPPRGPRVNNVESFTEFPSLPSSGSFALGRPLPGDIQRNTYASTIDAVVVDGTDGGGFGGEHIGDVCRGESGNVRDDESADVRPTNLVDLNRDVSVSERHTSSSSDNYRQWRVAYDNHLATLYRILHAELSRRRGSIAKPSKEDFEGFAGFVYNNSSGYISPYL